MKKIMKIFMVISVIILAFSCGKKEESKKLYVGTNAEYPPFEYLEGDKVIGFDIELITEIAKIINVDIEIKNMTFDGLLPALQAKTIDIVIAGMTATEERRKSVNFSDTYFIAQQALVLNQSNNTITNFESIKEYKVAVVLGYIGDISATKLGAANIERFNNTSESVLALKSGKVDVAVVDHAIAYGYAKQNPELKVIETDLAKQELAIGFRKEDTKLLEDVNAALNKLKEDGTYDKLVEKYFK